MPAEVDAILEDVEARVREAYEQAYEEARAKLESYLEEYGQERAEWVERVRRGEATQEEYQDWLDMRARRADVLRQQTEDLATDLANAAMIAEGIVNGSTEDAYIEGHAWGTFEVETLSGVGSAYTMFNHETLANLLAAGAVRLPAASVKWAKELGWDRSKIYSAIMQGILQGESIPQIARRLRRCGDMSRASATRMARTVVIGSSNLGTMDSFTRMRDEFGIQIQKVWKATLDNRVRHSHLVQDGERRELEEEFSNGCQYPGDPDGAAEEVYNCRCALQSYMPEFPESEVTRPNKLTEEQYKVWREAQAERGYGYGD